MDRRSSAATRERQGDFCDDRSRTGELDDGKLGSARKACRDDARPRTSRNVHAPDRRVVPPGDVVSAPRWRERSESSGGDLAAVRVPGQAQVELRIPMIPVHEARTVGQQHAWPGVLGCWDPGG